MRPIYIPEFQKPKKSKYGNIRTAVDGIAFDSKAEAERYKALFAMRRAGKIQGFGRQPSFVINDGNQRYRPDFIVCGNDGKIWVEDVKGCETATFKAKRQQWEAVYPWLPLVLIR